MNGDDPHALVDLLYSALADGDVVALASLLDAGFRAELSPNLPFGWGERLYVGPGDMILRGWGGVAAKFDVRAEVEHVHVADDGTAIVLGTYRGWCRRTGARLDAWFAHVWRLAGGHFVALRQITDTAAWRLAAADTVAPGQRRR